MKIFQKVHVSEKSRKFTLKNYIVKISFCIDRHANDGILTATVFVSQRSVMQACPIYVFVYIFVIFRSLYLPKTTI